MGSLISDASGLTVNAETPGVLVIGINSHTPMELDYGTIGDVFEFDLRIASGAPQSPSPINLLFGWGGTFTQATDGELQALQLVPPPSNGLDINDAYIHILISTESTESNHSPRSAAFFRHPVETVIALGSQARAPESSAVEVPSVSAGYPAPSNWSAIDSLSDSGAGAVAMIDQVLSEFGESPDDFVPRKRSSRAIRPVAPAFRRPNW